MRSALSTQAVFAQQWFQSKMMNNKMNVRLSMPTAAVLFEQCLGAAFREFVSPGQVEAKPHVQQSDVDAGSFLQVALGPENLKLLQKQLLKQF